MKLVKIEELDEEIISNKVLFRKNMELTIKQMIFRCKIEIIR